MLQKKAFWLVHKTDFPFLINIYRDIPEYVKYYQKACKEADISFLDTGAFEINFHGLDIPITTEGIREGIESNFLKDINDFDWNFIPICPYVVESENYLSSRIIDGLKSSSFDLELTKHKAKVFPIEKMDIGTAMRLFSFVSINEDIEAEVGG